MATLTLALNWSMAAAATARAPSLAIDIDSLSAASTKANVAVDMFLDANAQKAKLSTAAAYETMIWIGTVGGVQPFHSQNTSDPPTFDLSGTTFSLFMGPNQSNQTVFTWLASSNLTSLAPGHDFSPLLRYLYQHDLLPASTYLGTYQVGTETYHATKKVVFAAEAIQMGVGRKGGTSAPAPVGGSEQKKSDGVHVIGQARWGAIALVGCVLGLLVL
ncbi:uncharacterized protein KY384_003445 [Bacidia gigantensis]|uniref:uncharacterized protein n=1 Tax=Bacidia gigantensis TaxID=2732470 RepID=UPI001D056647|nr:uncharacterized protein KY384_003445 [Bacidia gigantensis]KAG8531809.1 hypothetical protein KY384_003445 [Bacidia gigantensis]